MAQWKLVFRGDNRSPWGATSPFQTGFNARNMQGPPVQHESEGVYTDFNPQSAVCITPDIEAAVVFPQNEMELTWVYAMGIDVTDPNTVNGHANQVRSHSSPAPPLFWYAREWAVKTVPGEQIVAGLQVRRTFQDGDTKTFTVIGHVMNSLCPLVDQCREVHDLFVEYIQDLKGRGAIEAFTTPDGFIISDRQGEGTRLTMEQVIERMPF